jgi:hypothetical protein
MRNLFPSSQTVIQHIQHPPIQQPPPAPQQQQLPQAPVQQQQQAPQAPPAAHQYFVRRQPNFVTSALQPNFVATSQPQQPAASTLPPPPAYETVMQQQQQQQQQPVSTPQRLLNAVWRMHYCPPVRMNPRHQVKQLTSQSSMAMIGLPKFNVPIGREKVDLEIIAHRVNKRDYFGYQ